MFTYDAVFGFFLPFFVFVCLSFLTGKIDCPMVE